MAYGMPKRIREWCLPAWGWPWAPVAAWAALIYLLLNLRDPRAVSPMLDMYVAQPLLWLSLGVLGLGGWAHGIAVKPRLTLTLALMAASWGTFQIALSVLAGLVYGFGQSPYTHGWPALGGNLFYAGAILAGIELSRACVVGALSKKRALLGLLCGSLFFSLLGIPIARWASIADVGGLLRFAGGTLLPDLAESTMASLLAILGGPLASMAYRGVLQLFQWISPILPDLPWMVVAFLGTLAPAMGMVMLWGQNGRRMPARQVTQRRSAHSTSAWVLVGLAGVTLLWLNTGLFGIAPTVVSGVSMEPAMRVGDLAIVRHVSPEKIGVGDIAQFKMYGTNVLHRVLSVEADNGRLHFITRGDANNTPDPPVALEQISGKVVLVIPRIGWPAIWARWAIEWLGGAR